MTYLPPELDEVRRLLVAWASGRPEIMRVYLFGSRIAGISKEGRPPHTCSDLDVAIELGAEHSELDLWFEKASTWRRQIAELSPWPVDVEPLLHGTGLVLRVYVEQSGVLVFERLAADHARSAP